MLHDIMADCISGDCFNVWISTFYAALCIKVESTLCSIIHPNTNSIIYHISYSSKLFLAPVFNYPISCPCYLTSQPSHIIYICAIWSLTNFIDLDDFSQSTATKTSICLAGTPACPKMTLFHWSLKCFWWTNATSWHGKYIRYICKYPSNTSVLTIQVQEISPSIL